MITNPILKGFNPDPSIVRVGNDYYIATSTFEWYPGVQIHHSRDLLHWRLLTRPLSRTALLDMTGVPDSCGVWAPCLSYADGLFWLIYTNVKRFDGNFKDTHNYLTTCATIDGEWSDPVYLNSSGFDPSLFHDENGSKWLVNMVWDHRPGRNCFGGIYLQEYSVEQQCLLGPVTRIFSGSELGCTEGPHLYQRNGYYYLLTAEGGTGYQHAMTMARSKNITGPYELDPIKHFVTAKDFPEHPLQRCGHGDWVETQAGEYYAVHLCSRPLSGELKRSPMGRESAIEKVQWNDEGWLRVANIEGEVGGAAPQQQVLAADLPPHPWPVSETRCRFNSAQLPVDFQWLRSPDPQTLFSLTERPGCLRLFGRESLGSLYASSLVARRQQAFCFDAVTKIEFAPQNFQQMAGLVSYYNAHKFHYLYISHNDSIGKHIGIMSCLGDQTQAATFPLDDQLISIEDTMPVYLQAQVRDAELNFSWSLDQQQWQTLSVTLDHSLLSDEAGKGEGANFTGAFIGMCCQDVSGARLPADFEFFDYQELV